MRLSALPLLPILFFVLVAAVVALANKQLKPETHDTRWVYVMLAGAITCLVSAVYAWL
ncbi:hypothetical protein D3C74_255050 [compost metagenome]